MWQLTSQSPALDLNSTYSYLLLCRHFSQTCLVAECGSDLPLAGFVTGYLPPGHPDTLFVWQIAVAADARRTGLGRRLIDALLDRLLPTGVRFLQATVSPGNQASRALFRSVARDRGVHLQESAFFDETLFPAEAGSPMHEPEMLLQLGPFDRTGRQDGGDQPKEAAL